MEAFTRTSLCINHILIASSPSVSWRPPVICFAYCIKLTFTSVAGNRRDEKAERQRREDLAQRGFGTEKSAREIGNGME